MNALFLGLKSMRKCMLLHKNSRKKRVFQQKTERFLRIIQIDLEFA